MHHILYAIHQFICYHVTYAHKSTATLIYNNLHHCLVRIFSNNTFISNLIPRTEITFSHINNTLLIAYNKRKLNHPEFIYFYNNRTHTIRPNEITPPNPITIKKLFLLYYLTQFQNLFISTNTT